MKPQVYQFENPDTQSVWYRGFVRTYQEEIIVDYNCKEVRPNRLKAKEDAQKLMKKLRATTK